MARRSKHPIAPITLTSALEKKTGDQLKNYQKILGSSVKTSQMLKAERVKAVRALLRGSKLRATWEKLDEIDKAAISEAAHDPMGEFHAEQFEAKYGDSPGFNWGDSSHHVYSAKPGLLSVFFHEGHIPEDLRAELKSFVPTPSEATLESSESLPPLNNEAGTGEHGDDICMETRLMEETALHDLFIALEMTEAGKLSVSDKTRQPTRASCTALGNRLFGGEYYDDDALAEQSHVTRPDMAGPIRSFAWPLLLQAGGLCEISGKRLRLSNAGRKSMTAPPEQTLRKLWQRWQKSTLLDEFRRIDAIKGQTGKAKRAFTKLANRREAIESVLLECPVGGWVNVDELFRHMQASGNHFEVTRDPWNLYITDTRYGSLGYEGYHDWEILQGRYILCLLFEFAATLGMIDVAYVPPHFARDDFRDMWGTEDMCFLSRYDGLQYFRMTPLGTYCLGMSDDSTISKS